MQVSLHITMGLVLYLCRVLRGRCVSCLEEDWVSHGGVGVSHKHSGCGVHAVSSVENSWYSRYWVHSWYSGNWVYSWYSRNRVDSWYSRNRVDVGGVVGSGKALVKGGLAVSLVAVSGFTISLALGLPLSHHPHPHHVVLQVVQVVLQTHIHSLHLVEVVIQTVLLHLLAVVHPHPLVVHV